MLMRIPGYPSACLSVCCVLLMAKLDFKKLQDAVGQPGRRVDIIYIYINMYIYIYKYIYINIYIYKYVLYNMLDR